MKKEEFKPYISDEHVQTEFTPTSIIIGILLSVVFGAANAYLGLRVGLTISASIPAAVISMGVLRIILRKNSILESNNPLLPVQYLLCLYIFYGQKRG